MTADTWGDERPLRAGEIAALAARQLMDLEAPEPVQAVAKRAIATTFWGQAWCRQLQRYEFYAQRLPVGRTLIRHGGILDLRLDGGVLRAQVCDHQVRQVAAIFTPIAAEAWEAIHRCAQGDGLLLSDLRLGKISDGLMAMMAQEEGGLFPSASDVRFHCTCIDDADLCPHGAAAMYGLAVRFDRDPELFFRLRGVSAAQLAEDGGQPWRPPAPSEAPDELAELFGITLDGSALI